MDVDQVRGLKLLNSVAIENDCFGSGKRQEYKVVHIVG